MKGGTFDLEERLLEYSCQIIKIVDRLPQSRSANHVAGQLMRSGTSPLPNHGEAQGAESRNDFLHKMSICLKELRETHRWLKLIARAAWIKEPSGITALIRETDELIRIFVSSIVTAKANAKRTPRVSPE
jgi:four helix bundle protein